jgi:hypothetical protein
MRPISPTKPGQVPIQPDILLELIRTYDRLLDLVQTGATVGAGGALTRSLRRDVTGKVLVTVHGIGTHVAGYSDGWWKAMSDYVPSLQPGDLDGKRTEVLWSNIVNSRSLTRDIDRGQAASVAEQIKATLRDRAQNDLDSAAAATPISRDGSRELTTRRAQIREVQSRRDLSIPNIGGIDDFTNYLVNSSIRARVLDRFFQVVRPLLQSGTEIEILSHSWGTVVAYEGLLQLEAESGITGQVHNFFTVGAALSIWAVKQNLIPAAKTGRRPSMVQQWVNLDARFDVVGGHLTGDPYEVDQEFLNLVAVGCTPSWLPRPFCSHGSYFNADNVAVNRDIFGAFIEG